MTTTAARLRTYWSERQTDRGQLTSFIARNWEVCLIVEIVMLGLVLRLVGLGGRAIHHDESIHVWYSWLLAGRGTSIFEDGLGSLRDWGSYTHDPTYHGPFQIFLTAGVFKIFGDTDFTGRLVPALVGTALVGMPFFLRGFIGRSGAFIAAVLIAFSPILLYVSRFARDDIYTAVYTLGIAILILRYMKEPKEGYLYGIPLLLMLGFVTFEFAFITTAIFLVYLEIQLAQDLYAQLTASRTFKPIEAALAYAVLIPLGWLIAALWPLLEEPRKRWSLTTMPPSGHLMIILGTFALPQFAAAIQEVPFIGQGTYMGEGALMRTSVFAAIAATAAIGLMWNSRVWARSAAIFYIPFFLLYTTFFANGGDIWNPINGHFWTGSGTDAGGFWTGAWGSLDYWLDQQLVRRGNQPNYYYFMFLPVYEFLPLVLSLGGTLYYAFRGRLEHSFLAGSAIILIFAFSIMPQDFPLLGGSHIHLAFITAIGVIFLLPIDQVLKFLIYWTLAIFYAITVAGEKMPWLSVHLALPLALLAARILNDICEALWAQVQAYTASRAPPAVEPTEPKRRRRRASTPEPEPKPAPASAAFAFHPLIPVAVAAACALIAAAIFQATGPASGAAVLAWLFAVAALIAVLGALRYGSWQLAGQVAVIALVAALGVFTIRVSVNANYDQGPAYTDAGAAGPPPELLIYAQGAADLDKIMAEIEAYADQTGQGKSLHVVYDDSVNVWPLPWYLRNYNSGPLASVESYVPEPNSVALFDISNRDQIEQNYADKVAFSQEYRHMWWFHDRYRGIEPLSFLGKVFTGAYIPTWRSYFIDRVVPGDEIETPDRVAYFFGDEPIQAVPTQTPQVEGTIAEGSQSVIGEPGKGDGQFMQPAGLTTDAEGNIYVVDTLNQRIEKFAPDGTFLDAVGQPGSGPGQFGNPRSPDYEIDDGPWGIAVDDAGNVYVADTWNYRIQKFDADLKFVATWGTNETLFGPRDLAIDSAGNLFVVDTGNKRIVKYTPDGQLIETFGQAGTGPAQFDEPSSISIAPDGDIYVADYWNRRVQHFDANFAYVSEFRIGSWGSRGVTDRAYIVALEDGTILATDPANGEVIVYGVDGRWLGAWHLVPEDITSRPVGITLGPNDRVYVSDGLTSEVRSFPLADILVEPAPVATGSPTPSPTPTLSTAATP